MVSPASFAPHREHFSRRTLALRLPAPQALTVSAPLSVRDAPQRPQSTFTEAPNRTRSAAVSICLVDMSDA